MNGSPSKQTLRRQKELNYQLDFPVIYKSSCWFKQIWRCLCGTDIPMSVGIVEPKTHPSQLNAAEFLWDMKKRTSVFVQVAHTSSLCATGCGSCCSCWCIETVVLAFTTLSLLVCHRNCRFWNPMASADIFRCTASAQSSLPGSTAERRASPSGSRLTPSPRETLESTQSTSTLPPAKSKSLRSTPFHSWVEVGVFSTLYLSELVS